MDKRIVALMVGGSLVLVLVMALLLGKQGGDSTKIGPGDVVVNIREGDWIRGNPNARVTLFEYSDFQCPACKAYAPIVKKLVDDYAGQVREVYRFFPLTSIHPNALPAARAAQAAGRQGKFWEMGEVLFSKQDEWSTSTTPETKFDEYAVSLGLDKTTFNKDMIDPETEKRVQLDLSDALRLNLSGTPTFYLNGRYLNLPGSYDNFKKVIDEELAKVTVSPTSPTASDSSVQN